MSQPLEGLWLKGHSVKIAKNFSLHLGETLKSKITILIILSLALCLLASTFQTAKVAADNNTPDVYVGVAIGYGWVEEEQALIDKVSSYTNLVVVARICGTTTNESIQVAAEKGMYVIPQQPFWDNVYREDTYPYYKGNFTDAQRIYGNYVLGQYFLDEPGGKIVDRSSNAYISLSGSDFVSMASQYESTLMDNQAANINSNVYPFSSYERISPKFTTDYALQWFDYKAGYDVVLTEFISNSSRQIQIAQARGAAAMMHKDWGVMISWDYTVPPYLESGPELYDDMILAYDNGAKYIVVYDASNPDQTNSESTLTAEHYKALQDFWSYIQTHPRHSYSIGERTAYVMPSGYAFGFRNPNDLVWGRQDSGSAFYYNSANALLQQYGQKLDIIYNEGLSDGDFQKYKSVIYSSEYTLPTDTPTVGPTDTPTPTPTSTGITDQGLPTEYLYAIVVVAVLVVAVAAGFMVLKIKKRAVPDLPPPPP